MESGVRNYWQSGGGFFPSSFGTTTGYNSPTALQYNAGLFAGIFGDKEPFYNSEENMDISCLTPGSTWELRAMVKLKGVLFGWGASCRSGETCPEIQITVFDGRGASVLSLATSNYANDSWSADTFNEIRSTFTLPSSGWDGSVSNVSIVIGGYFSWLVTSPLVLDDFAIRPIAGSR